MHKVNVHEKPLKTTTQENTEEIQEGTVFFLVKSGISEKNKDWQRGLSSEKGTFTLYSKLNNMILTAPIP